MTDEEKEIVKIGAEAAFKPFTNLAKRLFGGSVDQIGGAWEDRLMVRRQIRRIQLFKELQSAIDKAGFDPRLIPDSIWIPALQEALLHDDETLQTTWANLLANAADPSEFHPVLSSFPHILKELSARDAKFLNALYANYEARAATSDVADWKDNAARTYEEDDLLRVYAAAGLAQHPELAELLLRRNSAFSADIRTDLRNLRFTLDILQKHRILDKELTPMPLSVDDMQSRIPPAQDVVGINTVPLFRLTELGIAFVAACQAPSNSG